MAVKIRLRRVGAKKHPLYRVVVADSQSPRDGRFIESIGFYNPQAQPAVSSIDREKAVAWLRHGSIPTDTVKALFRYHGIFAEAANKDEAGAEAGAE